MGEGDRLLAHADREGRVKCPTGGDVRALHALLAFVGTVPAVAPRSDLACALHALANALGFDVVACAADAPPEPRAALGILAASVDGLEDPQRAAASACLAWVRDLLVPVILHRAGWRQSTATLGAWIDPHAPGNLHDEESALARLDRDLAA